MHGLNDVTSGTQSPIAPTSPSNNRSRALPIPAIVGILVGVCVILVVGTVITVVIICFVRGRGGHVTEKEMKGNPQHNSYSFGK